MWTDTHLHLTASEYDPDRPEVIARARQQHVNRFVLPAVSPSEFQRIQQLAHQTAGAVYCLGIHPLAVQECSLNDLAVLRSAIVSSLDDPLFAGVGEIGLDGFVPNPDWARQTLFFEAQLKMAVEFGLPVVMHVRKSQDLVLKGLRRFKPVSGIAHAFNGSFQQAGQFVDLNICLGFGGAMTFTRALQIRRLATEMPLEAIVLETDGPDIPPEWINRQRNEPCHINQIAHLLCELRDLSPKQLSSQTQLNAERVLPALSRTASLLQG